MRKAYGAGLYAMCGPAFEPDACIALPQASIAVMGPEAAVNAVYYNKIQEVPEGPSATPSSRSCATSTAPTSTSMKLASELVIDAVVPGERLRDELRRTLRSLRRQERAATEAQAHGASRIAIHLPSLAG